ncbi:hypothetical protein [Deinococcus depolymerans]|uniref:Uncharacterized protein n=1 Tax=Deinococcus depolymerans TaxID=392408 RepID=A0ABN1CHZ3_9DEIO
MTGQALVLCEHRPDPQGGWELTARFLHAAPATLRDQLERAGVGGRPHPDDLSLQSRSELLFQDEEALDTTTLSVTELHAVQAHAPPDEWGNLHAWAAFMYALDPSGEQTRLIVWFTEN